MYRYGEDDEEDDIVVRAPPPKKRNGRRRGQTRRMKEFVVRNMGYRDHNEDEQVFVPVNAAKYAPLHGSDSRLQRVHDVYPQLAARQLFRAAYSKKGVSPDLDYYIAVWQSTEDAHKMYIYKTYLAWRDATSYIREPHEALVTLNVGTFNLVTKISEFRDKITALTGEYIGKPESGVIFEDDESARFGRDDDDYSDRSPSQFASPSNSQVSKRSSGTSGVMETTNRIVRGLRIRD